MRQSMLRLVSSSAAGSLAARAAMVIGLTLAVVTLTSKKAEATSFTYYFSDVATEGSLTLVQFCDDSTEFCDPHPVGATNAIQFQFATFTGLDISSVDARVLSDGFDLASAFPGQTCLTYSVAGCIQYFASPTTPYNDGLYDVRVGWTADTTGAAPTSDSGHLLAEHVLGESEVRDITSAFFPTPANCPLEGPSPPLCDSGIVGETDNFTVFQVDSSANAVPEPATLVLFGTGLLAAVRASRFKKKTRP